jgi:uncharacterized protein with PQ loop repeat
MNKIFYSWFLGTISNLLWFIVFLPQMYNNYKYKNSDAISLLLLMYLLLGEILSIFSAIGKELNIVIIYIGIYHIIIDILMIIQLLYYRISTETVPLISQQMVLPKLTKNEYSSIFTSLLLIVLGLIVLITNNIVLIDIMGWVATFIFMIARIPQIHLNYKNKSVRGLSLYSFLIIMLSTAFFFLSIIILADNLEYIFKNIQWIAGSLISLLFFDTIILYQFFIYT